MGQPKLANCPSDDCGMTQPVTYGTPESIFPHGLPQVFRFPGCGHSVETDPEVPNTLRLRAAASAQNVRATVTEVFSPVPKTTDQR